jgi:folate-binding protein YgfZ
MTTMQTLHEKLLTPTLPAYAIEGADSQAAMVSLLHLRAYRISGDDASSFLQGQFTNDVNLVSADQAQLSAYCTPKGRMLAIFYLCRWQNDYVLICPADIAESFMQRLKMYIMRSKVSIAEASDEVLLGIIDPEQTLPSQIFSSSCVTTDDTDKQHSYVAACTDDYLCFTLPGPSNRYLMLCKSDASDEITQSLQKIEHVFPESVWKQMDIMSGLPFVDADTQELFVPQMTNMELIEGVSFSKGCYPGQEVVARLHYLGNANRRMFQFSCHSDKDLTTGEDIVSTLSDKAIGKVLSVEKTSEQDWIGLAVLRIENIQEDGLQCKDSRITITSLPYNVPLEGKKK